MATVFPEEVEKVISAAVTTAVREHLAGYKVPRTVLIAPVPRAPNGKIMFDAARQPFSS